MVSSGVTRAPTWDAELDAGDPVALGREYASLLARFPQLTILGGCCSTDERHVEEIARTGITSAWPRSDGRD